MLWKREFKEKRMKNWSDLGVVETIFEEESEDLHSLSSAPLSPPFSSSSPSSPLQSAVDSWTTTTGRKPDVKIYIQGICFHLHKKPLITESGYLKRHLLTLSELTLSPPFNITPDTFKQIADFCYSGHVVITPFNVAALRTAAELLSMNGDSNDSDGSCSGESLRQRTEYYFLMVVAVNKEFACSVFRSCLSLLPEVEQTAFLASRCIEALFAMDDGDIDGDGVERCGEELKGVSIEDFGMMVESMQRRSSRSHDLIYRVVDVYFLVYRGGKISEEEKSEICSSIDCSLISSPLLMHAVQNPRMPLRFIVQAMLIEQLNTHRTLFSTITRPRTRIQPQPQPQPQQDHDYPATLGAILERDAAIRQVAHLRAALDTTTSRIQTLERELNGMKEVLATESEKQKHKNLLLLEQPGRSSSCRFITATTNNNDNTIERGERGSVSASMLRFGNGRVMASSSSSNLKRNPLIKSPNKTKAGVKKNMGQRFILGLKTAFGVSNNNHKLKNVKQNQHKLGSDVAIDNGFTAILKNLPSGDS